MRAERGIESCSTRYDFMTPEHRKVATQATAMKRAIATEPGQAQASARLRLNSARQLLDQSPIAANHIGD